MRTATTSSQAYPCTCFGASQAVFHHRESAAVRRKHTRRATGRVGGVPVCEVAYFYRLRWCGAAWGKLSAHTSALQMCWKQLLRGGYSVLCVVFFSVFILSHLSCGLVLCFAAHTHVLPFRYGSSGSGCFSMSSETVYARALVFFFRGDFAWVSLCHSSCSCHLHTLRTTSDCLLHAMGQHIGLLHRTCA